jgi:hypothetical protein
VEHVGNAYHRERLDDLLLVGVGDVLHGRAFRRLPNEPGSSRSSVFTGRRGGGLEGGRRDD